MGTLIECEAGPEDRRTCVSCERNPSGGGGGGHQCLVNDDINTPLKPLRNARKRRVRRSTCSCCSFFLCVCVCFICRVVLFHRSASRGASRRAPDLFCFSLFSLLLIGGSYRSIVVVLRIPAGGYLVAGGSHCVRCPPRRPPGWKRKETRYKTGTQHLAEEDSSEVAKKKVR